MDLERQHIVIRERTFAELLDLTLRVFRAHAAPLLIALAVGAVPLGLLNAWLLHGLLAYEPTIVWENMFDLPDYLFWLGFWFAAIDSLVSNLPYLSLMAVLIALEAPIATAAVTLYLGHWTFSGEPRRREMLEAWVETFPQLLLFEGLLRPFYLMHAYLPEIILLERTPLRVKNGEAISTMRRNRALHWGEKGRIFAQRLLAFLLAAFLFSCWYTLVLFGYVLVTGDPNAPPLLLPWSAGLLMWFLAGLMTVLRFLCYMNVRIRHEGWEVELAMRVERGRLTGPSI